MTQPLTRPETRALVGPADDATLTELIELGVTRAELLESLAWVENDEAMLNEGRPMPTGRVAQAIEILKARDDEDALADAGPP
jgi:hypothetical protein